LILHWPLQRKRLNKSDKRERKKPGKNFDTKCHIEEDIVRRNKFFRWITLTHSLYIFLKMLNAANNIKQQKYFSFFEVFEIILYITSSTVLIAKFCDAGNEAEPMFHNFVRNFLFENKLAPTQVPGDLSHRIYFEFW